MKQKMVRCADVLDVRDGTHDSPKYVLEGYPLITSKNIKEGNIEFDNVNYISKDDFEKINLRSKVDNGDILMPMIGTIGNPVVVNTDRAFAIKNVALFKFSENSKFNNRYIYYALKSPLIIHQLNSNKRGGTQSFVSLTNIRDLKIPNVDISTQNRIANVLDKAQELIDKRKEQIEACDELIKSLFHHMFGDPIQNNKKLPKLQLKEIGDWKTGGTPVRSQLEYYKGNIPWLSSGELNSIYTKDSIEHITEQAIAQSAAKLISKRSLLLGMYDTAALKSTINLVECTCNQAIAFAKLFDDKVSTVFVYFCIQIGKDFYKSQQRGVRQKNLNLSMIKDIEIIFPPLELQNEFAKKVEKIEQQKQLLEQSLTELENNFNSLMQKAFKGELF